MQLPDLINACFEACGGLAVFDNVRMLLKHKTIRGSSIKTSAFFTSFGVWNLYFYYHLTQWISWAGSGVLCVGNVIWFVLALYYMRREKNHARLLVLSGETGVPQ